MLQESWISLCQSMKDEAGADLLVETLTLENQRGDGCCAYGIDGVSKDFKDVAPLILWQKVNQLLIEDLKKFPHHSLMLDWVKDDQEFMDFWIERLEIIDAALGVEVKKVATS